MIYSGDLKFTNDHVYELCKTEKVQGEKLVFVNEVSYYMYVSKTTNFLEKNSVFCCTQLQKKSVKGTIVCKHCGGNVYNTSLLCTCRVQFLPILNIERLMAITPCSD